MKDQMESGKMVEAGNLENIFKMIENLKPIAQKLDMTLAQLALAWVYRIFQENFAKILFFIVR